MITYQGNYGGTCEINDKNVSANKAICYSCKIIFNGELKNGKVSRKMSINNKTSNVVSTDWNLKYGGIRNVKSCASGA